MGNKSVIWKQSREQNKSKNTDILLAKPDEQWPSSARLLSEGSHPAAVLPGTAFLRGCRAKIPALPGTNIFKVKIVQTCKQKIQSAFLMGILSVLLYIPPAGHSMFWLYIYIYIIASKWFFPIQIWMWLQRVQFISLQNTQTSTRSKEVFRAREEFEVWGIR